jgi:chlorite dismutase
LNPEQLKDFDRHKRFKVIGSRGGHYLIGNRSKLGHYNVRKLRGDEEMVAYCTTLHVAKGQTRPYPTYDVMLAQKLQIENDEDTFLYVAPMKRLSELRYY